MFKAIELYENAVQLGNSQAMFNLAFVYEIGNGVEKDNSKSYGIIWKCSKTWKFSGNLPFEHFAAYWKRTLTNKISSRP